MQSKKLTYHYVVSCRCSYRGMFVRNYNK